MATVDVGDRAPAFALPDQEGRTHRLKLYAGRPVVLYFYPKDDTPGCTREACDFRDSHSAFERLGAAILGVSVLDAASKARFAAKHGLRFPRLIRQPGCPVEVGWGDLEHNRVTRILRNPRYAGAFFYGRTRFQKKIDGGGRVQRLLR